MTIYEELGFTEKEVACMLDYIRNDTADVNVQAKKDKKTIQTFKHSVDEAIKHLELMINTTLPEFYRSHCDAEVKQSELAGVDPESGIAYFNVSVIESDPLNPKLVTALEALKRIPEVNYNHEGQNFPTKGKDRLYRAYVFLRKRYEKKTGKKAGRTNDPDTNKRTGDFLDFVRQVSIDIDERWIKSLVSHSDTQLAKANKNKT